MSNLPALCRPPFYKTLMGWSGSKYFQSQVVLDKNMIVNKATRSENQGTPKEIWSGNRTGKRCYFLLLMTPPDPVRVRNLACGNRK
ncbi:Protein CBG27828 [Caenorhabditis briggsae]|uniref:Protein CBG27828 n=1 Tax=Caenorhabditis briggsae TaxID=6238 RepID=B6IKB0_CAEBR|nr:Protein CBG27828 [Caenorhabditis briggsae]CAS00340.1 Protein CBG27828 [Caenorhabditis briggsae]